MTTVDEGKFVFVYATGKDSAGALQANRRKVRQQARKHVNIRWKTSRLQSLDIRQVPGPQPGSKSRQSPSRDDQEAKGKIENKVRAIVIHSGSGHDSKKSIADSYMRPKIPRSPTARDYAAARARYNVDLSWLSSFTISHVGSMRMDANPKAWLHYRESTFLDLVPSYYAHSRILQRVVDGMLAKAAHVLCPSQKTRKISLCTYGQALKEIQAALSDRELAKSTEMLCAIRMLQIYELLDVSVPEDHNDDSVVEQPTEPNPVLDDTDDHLGGWKVVGTQSIGSHTQGMQSLIMMRSPDSFKTDMDKSLLCSLLESLWLHAYLSNGDYFLERPEWQSFIRSCFNFKDVIRHPVTLCLWLTLSKLPRLLRQANKCVQIGDISPRREFVQHELRNLKTNLSQWINHFEKSGCHLPHSEALYQELLGFSLGTLAITCRVLVALDPAAENALDLEAEAQALSRRTFGLLIEHIISSGFFVGVCIWTTATEWHAGICNAKATAGSGDKPVLLDSEIFAKWNGMMGRKPHSDRLGTPWRTEVDDAIRHFLGTADADLASSKPFYRGVIWYL